MGELTRFTFVIPGPPVAKGRPRAARQGGGVRMVTPKKTREHERTVRLVAAEVFSGAPWEGAVRVDILAICRRPKRLMRKKDPQLLWCQSKPDADNIRKAVLDGISAAGCWRDDSQVCAGETRKLYASKTGRPCTVVVVSRLPALPVYDEWFFGVSEWARLAGCRFDAAIAGGD